MGEVQVSHRFGWDAPARIQATTNLLAGADEMPVPGETTYQTLLPFPLLAGVGLPGGAGSYSVPEWRQEATRFDLYFPAGDDVTIPVTFLDSAYPNLDLSDQAAWQWYSHIRMGEGPNFKLVAEFICESEYFPPVSPEEGKTVVTLFLPRQRNWLSGNFYWDLQGISPVPLGPEEVPGEDDPTPGTAYTLLSGRCCIGKQVTTLPGEWPPKPEGPYQGTSVFLAITVGGMKTVGPTGQVG